jgi:hypothetical protein
VQHEKLHQNDEAEQNDSRQVANGSGTASLLIFEPHDLTAMLNLTSEGGEVVARPPRASGFAALASCCAALGSGSV